MAEPRDAFRFIAAVEDLDVFHHLLAGVISFVVVGDSVMICVIPSIKSAGAVGDVPLCGVCIKVLVLGWLLSSRLNNGLLCVSGGCVVAAVPISGGGVAVGW